MKKIHLIFSFLFAVLFVSCTDDGGSSVIDLKKGALPRITKLTSTENSINLVALNNGLTLNLGVQVDKQTGDVASMDIVGFYFKSGVVSKAYLKRGITTFPSNFSFSQVDLFNAFESLNTVSDIQPGDKLVVTTELTLTDGSVLKILNNDGSNSVGADVTNNPNGYILKQVYDVSCPLNDASNFNGNYKVLVDDWADYAVNAVVPVEYNPSNGLFEFRILNTNNPFVANSATTYLIVTINPDDSTVVVVSSAEVWSYGSGPANQFTVTGDGTVSSCTGDINLSLDFVNANGGSATNLAFNLVKN